MVVGQANAASVAHMHTQTHIQTESGQAKARKTAVCLFPGEFTISPNNC